METQSYARHAHRPVLTTIAGLFTLVAMVLLIMFLFRQPSIISFALVLLSFGVFTLVIISRAYTVRLQDRIIRLEMLGRLARIGRDHDFARLSTQQIVALRFASDGELAALLDRTLAENLTSDQIKRAVVSWQPGAVPSGVSVSLAAADAAPAITGTGVSLTFTPAQASLPWPVDVAYAAAPAGQVVGFSRDGKIWAPLASLATSALPAGVATGFYTDGSVLHLLTRRAGRIALFRPGRWGDPRRISLRAPVPKRLTPTRAIRQRDGSLLVVTRVLLPSQAHLYVGLVGWPAKQSLLLQPGAIPLRLRVPARRLRSGVTARLRVAAVDPWSRRGTLTLAFRVP